MTHLRILISALLLSFLVGCSSAPQSSTGQAVYYALQTDVQLRLWVEHCQDMSSKAKQSAWQAKKNWWRRNGAFVEGADFGLTREIMLVSGERDVTGANITCLRLRTLWVYQTQIKAPPPFSRFVMVERPFVGERGTK
jgi:hypothetical protein